MDRFDEAATRLVWAVINWRMEQRDLIDSMMKAPTAEWFIPVVAAALRAEHE